MEAENKVSILSWVIKIWFGDIQSKSLCKRCIQMRKKSAFSHLKFWSQEIQAKNQRKNRTILHKKVRKSIGWQAGIKNSSKLNWFVLELIK